MPTRDVKLERQEVLPRTQWALKVCETSTKSGDLEFRAFSNIYFNVGSQNISSGRYSEAYSRFSSAR